MVRILYENKVTEFGLPAGDELWVSSEEMAIATGWMLKPEGFCKGKVCVPLPMVDSEEFVQSGRVNLAKVWEMMGKPISASSKGDVWSLGESAQNRNEKMLSLDAPNFSLPDFHGKLHSLADYRRKRVLLITWASW